MKLSPELEKFLVTDADPSIRTRTLRELLERPAGDPALRSAEEEIGRSGWAAEILRVQQDGGHWEVNRDPSGDDLYTPKYIATNWRLIVLSELGVAGKDPRITRAVELLLRFWYGPQSPWGDAFGGKGSELCITGNGARVLLTLGFEEHPAAVNSLNWLIGAQKEDGGWHCFPSETGTLDCWEALAAFLAVPKPRRTPAMLRSIERGAEFYLEHGLLSDPDGKPYAPWSRYHYPHHYYYDVLLGLDLLTALGFGKDPRLRPRLDELEQRRNADGTWSLDALHPDLPPDNEYQLSKPHYPFVLEAPHRPSRWATLTALLVLRRAERV
ncbi:MAG: hypothetical protein L3K07_02120 [Thermoplasmata archaeon]|nr:hypothetical protein [Thermoplasmata archaeon]